MRRRIIGCLLATIVMTSVSACASASDEEASQRTENTFTEDVTTREKTASTSDTPSAHEQEEPVDDSGLYPCAAAADTQASARALGLEYPTTELAVEDPAGITTIEGSIADMGKRAVLLSCSWALYTDAGSVTVYVSFNEPDSGMVASSACSTGSLDGPLDEAGGLPEVNALGGASYSVCAGDTTYSSSAYPSLSDGEELPFDMADAAKDLLLKFRDEMEAERSKIHAALTAGSILCDSLKHEAQAWSEAGICK